MAKYIECEAVHDAVSKLKRLAWQSSSTSPNAKKCVAVELDAVHAAVENIPAADVRPVVLCRDCKNSEPWYADKSRCFLWHESGIDVFNDGFCNYGEKREES